MVTRKRKAMVFGGFLIDSQLDHIYGAGTTHKRLQVIWAMTIPPEGDLRPRQPYLINRQRHGHDGVWGYLSFDGEVFTTDDGRNVLEWWWRLREAIDAEDGCAADGAEDAVVDHGG